MRECLLCKLRSSPMLGDEIDTATRLKQSSTANKTRIDFNDDWTTLRPPELKVRWPPAKAEGL